MRRLEGDDQSLFEDIAGERIAASTLAKLFNLTDGCSSSRRRGDPEARAREVRADSGRLQGYIEFLQERAGTR